MHIPLQIRPRERQVHGPVALGIGKVVLSRSAGQPELQIFIGFNKQFLKK
jgi:hypothetical protein